MTVDKKLTNECEEERRRCDSIVCEEWQKAVKEWELRPGSITEKVVAQILERIRHG